MYRGKNAVTVIKGLTHAREDGEKMRSLVHVTFNGVPAQIFRSFCGGGNLGILRSFVLGSSHWASLGVKMVSA